MLAATALLCLTLNVYHEARGEPEEGKIAVAQATLARAKEEGGVCNAVFRDKQFSWTNKHVRVVRKGGDVVSFKLMDRLVPKDVQALRNAGIVAVGAMRGWYPDYARGATFYHAKSVRPEWSSKFKRVASIGQHIFYRENL